MRWCKECRSAAGHDDECRTCVLDTATGHIVGVKLVEAFLKSAASKEIAEYAKRTLEKVVKLEIENLAKEAVKQEALALAAITSPWQWSPIVAEYIMYLIFKAVGASEEDARKYSSRIGLGTAMTAGCMVGGPVGLGVGGAAWIIGHAIPMPFSLIRLFFTSFPEKTSSVDVKKAA